MPELPEVETIRRTLEQLVLDKTIREVRVTLPRIIRNLEVDEFQQLLKGRTITTIDRRGKFLLFRLSGELTLISHLRMEGNYGLFTTDIPLAKHTHVVFAFTDGTELRYRDTRQFGTMDVIETEKVEHMHPIGSLGPEPFDVSWTKQKFFEKIKGKKKSIKAVLLDQEIVAGIGNIYADEILFRSGVSPMTLSQDLSRNRAYRIFENTQLVLAEAIEAGGSSIKSYVNGQGKMGLFQQQLFIYQRHGKPCYTCGSEILKTRVAGRGTHYCPKCQKNR